MTYYCGECGQECTVHAEDFGIGHYECHGRRGYDSRPALVSDCCEGDVYDDPELTTESDLGEWMLDQEAAQSDYEYERWKEDQLDR